MARRLQIPKNRKQETLIMAHTLRTRFSRLLSITIVGIFALPIGCISEVDSSEADPTEEFAPGMPCNQQGQQIECASDPTLGVQSCNMSDIGLVWSECNANSGSSASTPLVFVFGSESVEFNANTINASNTFDLNGTMSVMTDWPYAKTPWLAFDRNGNGSIDHGGELFGSAVKLSGADFAQNGFQALAELDENRDGRIDANDSAFALLSIWSDQNSDRASSKNELQSLSSRSIVSIDLAYTIAPRCDARGNCERERAAFHYLDEHGHLQSGSIVDIHLKHQ